MLENKCSHKNQRERFYTDRIKSDIKDSLVKSDLNENNPYESQLMTIIHSIVFVVDKIGNIQGVKIERSTRKR